MSLSPELQRAYDASYLPFYESANVEEAKARSWRYFLEINSACQLKCPTCTKGNMAGYDHQTGIMDIGLMERILDKIAKENPKAVVCMYGNSEPFLHPKLPWCIAAIKKRGLHAQFSTNLNYVHHLDETLAANPNVIIISLSGFTQGVYERGHTGGNIEKVKANMKLVSEANTNARQKVNIWVTYHIYKDNDHELPLMRDYALSLGFMFIPAVARAISMENAIQYCRSKDPDATPFDDPALNAMLPPVGETYVNTMDRLKIPPTKAREMYQQYPVAEVCPVGAGGMFSFVRHDGKIQLCACTADRRLTLGNYLEMTSDQMIEKRTGHSFCKQCLKYRTNMYFHLVDREKWEP